MKSGSNLCDFEKKCEWVGCVLRQASLSIENADRVAAGVCGLLSDSAGEKGRGQRGISPFPEWSSGGLDGLCPQQCLLTVTWAIAAAGVWRPGPARAWSLVNNGVRAGLLSPRKQVPRGWPVPSGMWQLSVCSFEYLHMSHVKRRQWALPYPENCTEVVCKGFRALHRVSGCC